MLALATPSAAAAAFSDSFDGLGTIANPSTGGSASTRGLNTCSGAKSPESDRLVITSKRKTSSGTPALTNAAIPGVAAPATLGPGVPRRVDAVHPEVDAELRPRHAVVHRQVGDAGFHQHVLAEQRVAGVLPGGLVEDDVGRVGVHLGLAGPPHRLVAAEEVL